MSSNSFIDICQISERIELRHTFCIESVKSTSDIKKVVSLGQSEGEWVKSGNQWGETNWFFALIPFVQIAVRKKTLNKSMEIYVHYILIFKNLKINLYQYMISFNISVNSKVQRDTFPVLGRPVLWQSPVRDWRGRTCSDWRTWRGRGRGWWRWRTSHPALSSSRSPPSSGSPWWTGTSAPGPVRTSADNSPAWRRISGRLSWAWPTVTTTTMRSLESSGPTQWSSAAVRPRCSPGCAGPTTAVSQTATTTTTVRLDCSTCTAPRGSWRERRWRSVTCLTTCSAAGPPGRVTSWKVTGTQ